MRKTIGLSLLLLLVASTPAVAKQAQSADQQPVPDVKAKPAKAAVPGARGSNKRHHAARKPVSRTDRRHRSPPASDAVLPPPDQHVGAVQLAGQREVGRAAWYGGRHLGHRMANGERLDAVRATAAHRTLPLESLVRVTNLHNGRSVIAKITDRGPVSPSLVIDVSPRAADVLDMKRAGIATVAIEPVIPAAQASPGTTRLAQQ